jgi:ribosomal RNA-processing protein 12
MSSSAPPSAEFATALDNVRRLTSSKLAHASKPAKMLTAIEETFIALKIDTFPPSPTAYFVSLLQCLEKACKDEIDGDEEAMAETENMGQGGTIPATLYLLAIVVPETPGNVVISKLSTMMDCILPLFSTAMEHPPALKSMITIITSLILFAPPQILNSSPLLKKSWAYLLELNLDSRPKVRHVAQEGVRKVLCTPVPPKVVAGNHPYLPKAREWVVGILEEEAKTGGASGAGGKKKARFAGAGAGAGAEAEDGEGKRAIWVVQGLRGWSAVWGESVRLLLLPCLGRYRDGELTNSTCRDCVVYYSPYLPSHTSHRRSTAYWRTFSPLHQRTAPPPFQPS